MKWLSVLGVVAFVSGIVMVLIGQNANDIKAENREALILYGILFCFISVVWLVIHGLTIMLRKES